MPSATSDETAELIPMRADERQDPERVGAFLAGKVPGAQGTPELLQFGGGKANLTYLVRYPDAEYVLRRPPLGPVAPRSHDMGREYAVLSRLYQAFPLAPRAYLFHEAPDVVGAPFVLMERRTGIVIRREMPPGFRNDPALNARISRMVVETLADLHEVNPVAVGLDTLGKPAGFMARQVRGWAGRWEAAATEAVPAFDAVHAWLAANVPPEPAAGLVHNDFKLDNLMVDATDPATPVAVFDWDMCTLGDPLADLGTLLGYWAEAGDSGPRAAFPVMPSQEPGFLRREALKDVYAARSSYSLDRIGYYEAFGLWKTAVIIQQIYVRWVRGQTQDARFRDYGERAKGLAQAAQALVERL